MSPSGNSSRALKRTADARKGTIDGYAIAFRKIISDLEGLSDDPSRFAPHGAGRIAWLAKIHAIKLATITLARVQKWKRDFLKPFENNPLKLRTAQISVNSFLRRAKSLFSKKLTKHLGHITFTNPFDGVAFEKRPSMRYRSGFDVRELLQAAREELFDLRLSRNYSRSSCWPQPAACGAERLTSWNGPRSAGIQEFCGSKRPRIFTLKANTRLATSILSRRL
jgi:hypothetical protein